MLLQARGYEVVGVAEDIASGVAAVHELRPDCVVMDINLPDGNGVDAAARLAIDSYVPAVVLVSTLDASAVGDVEASGARGFVPKAELASPRLESCSARREHPGRHRRGPGAAARRGSCGCSATRASRSWPRPATRPTCCARSARTRPTSRSSTSRCRRTTPTTACAPRWRSAAASRRSACSCSRQYAEERYAVDLIGDSAEGVGYLLKDRVTDFTLFADAVRRVGGGRLGARSHRGRAHARPQAPRRPAARR